MLKHPLDAAFKQSINNELGMQDAKLLSKTEWAELTDDAHWEGQGAARTADAVIRRRASKVQVPSSTPERSAGDPTHDAYRRAWMAAAYSEANRRPDVEAWRCAYLGGRLVSWDELEAWIGEAVELQGRPTLYVTIAIPPGFGTTGSVPIDLDRQGGQVEALDYALPKSGFVHVVATAQGSPLDHLRVLSEQLAGDFPWQPAQAATFVVTGATPVPVLLSTTVRKVLKGTGLQTISIEGDAELDPERIAEAWRGARRIAFGVRPRPQSERGLRLAGLVARHPESGWEARRTLWNREYPDRFDSLRKFRLAAQAASRRFNDGPGRRPA